MAFDMSSFAKRAAQRRRKSEKDATASRASTASVYTTATKTLAPQPSGAAATPDLQFDGKAAVLKKDKGPVSPVATPVNTSKRLAPEIAGTQTKSDEHQDKQNAFSRESQAISHKNHMETLQFQRESDRLRDERAEANWYARQEYLESKRNRVTGWKFRANAGKRTATFKVFGRNTQQPAQFGSIQNNRWVPAQPQAAQPVQPVQPQATQPSQPQPAKLPTFSKADAASAVPTDVSIPGDGGKPRTKTGKPWKPGADVNGRTAADYAEMIARASKSGAKVTMVHQAVDAEGKNVGSGVILRANGGAGTPVTPTKSELSGAAKPMSQSDMNILMNSAGAQSDNNGGTAHYDKYGRYLGTIRG